ncbi:MAG: extracellular solute-binding protein [Chloroflexi bacterium]|nr:MAG: extracellular solute-binding protein [Chloroflexota bacterium]
MKYLLSIVVILLSLVSCTSPGTVAAPTLQNAEYRQSSALTEPGTIHIWTSWEGAIFERLQQAVDVFQNTHPQMSFEIQFIPFNQISAAYRTAVENGGGPEILIAPGSIGGELFLSGLAANTSPFLRSEMQVDLQPAAISSVSWEDSLIGVPLVMSGVVMYRNASVFKSAPATFEELKVLSAAASDKKTSVYLDGGFFFTGGHLFGLGSELMDQEGHPELANNRGAAWLSLIKELAEFGPLAFNSDDDLHAFLEGNTGILFDGTWNLNRIRESLGEEKLSIDPWPAVDGRHLSGFVQTDNAYLNPIKLNTSQTASLDFLKFLISPQAQTIFLQAGQIPVHNSLDIPDPFIQKIRSVFEGSTAYPVDPVMDRYSSSLNTALQRLLYEGWSVEDILVQAEQDILRDLDRDYP